VVLQVGRGSALGPEHDLHFWLMGWRGSRVRIAVLMWGLRVMCGGGHWPQRLDVSGQPRDMSIMPGLDDDACCDDFDAPHA
jgi:hypothetical protein